MENKMGNVESINPFSAVEKQGQEHSLQNHEAAENRPRLVVLEEEVCRVHGVLLESVEAAKGEIHLAMREDLEKRMAGMREDLEKRMADMREDLEKRMADIRADHEKGTVDMRDDLEKRMADFEGRFPAGSEHRSEKSPFPECLGKLFQRRRDAALQAEGGVEETRNSEAQ